MSELGHRPHVRPLQLGCSVKANPEEASVERAVVSYTEKLDGSFFRVRLDRATELERAYMRAMAELGPAMQSAGDVARLLNRTSQQCAPTRSTLIQKGLLYTPEHGYAKFTAPHFDQLMREAVPAQAVPELVVPELRSRPRRSGATTSS